MNPEHCFANKQTKKMGLQQLQITVTELPKIFFKVNFFVLFFGYFILIFN